MKPCWKVIHQRAINMNNIVDIYKHGSRPTLILQSESEFNSIVIDFPTESERDEAFEYLMRDEEKFNFEQWAKNHEANK